MWEATSGATVARMQHDGGVNAIAVDSVGQRVASGNEDGTVRLWNIRTGREVARTEGSKVPEGMAMDAETGGRVTTVAISQDGRWLASGGDDGLVSVWDLQIEDEDEPPEEGEPPEEAIYQDEVVYLEEVASMEHTDKVSALVFSPHGHWLVSASWDGTTQVWEIASETEIARTVHGGKVQDVAFNPIKNWFATASEDRTAQVWETEAGEEIARMNHAGW
ncbi:MAG: hypothetical protein GY842_11495, partial [bacterium]|nr:hypothetical protein [bacterium]